MRLMHCRADMQIQLTGALQLLTLSKGIDYDLDREVTPGHPLAEFVEGREDCFEPVPAPAPAPAVKTATVMLDRTRD